MRKNLMSRKWEIITELIEKMDADDMLNTVEKRFIGKILYAPHIGYRAWIFHYKRIPVCLWDQGNCHYEFHSAVSRLDVLIAWLYEKYDWFRYKKEMKK